MNLDDRLEALTHSVELLVGMQKDNEKRFAEQIQRHEQQFERVMRLFEMSARRFDKIEDAITRLVRIADNHEDRIDHLEQPSV